MGVPNSYQQRTGTDWQWTPSGYPTARLGIGDDRRVHINPRRQQSLNNIDVPLANREQEWCKSRNEPRVDVGAGSDEREDTSDNVLLVVQKASKEGRLSPFRRDQHVERSQVIA